MYTSIVVIGSSNTDMVIKASKLPKAGETVIGGVFLMNPGGKGANQAVAAARLGGKVKFIGKVGNDIFGKQALRQISSEKIDVSSVSTDSETPSGVALINVDQHGENSIIVAPGANNKLSLIDIEHAVQEISASAILLVQLEIPLESVYYAVKNCSDKGVTVILNPAPAQGLSDELLKCITIITPNETEAELLTGIAVNDINSATKAAKVIFEKGVGNVIITLGVQGALIFTDKGSIHVSAPLVTPKDTTAAGDCFNGSLAVALAENMSLKDAVEFACKAASISTTKMGAQSSIPYRREVDDLKFFNK